MNNDHAAEKGDAKRFEVEVNGHTIILVTKEATGLQIKEAAIAQGVNIQLNFVLQQELPNGSSAIIGDADVVHIHPHLKFTAIAPDDNS
jgi:Multiubiquitin